MPAVLAADLADLLRGYTDENDLLGAAAALLHDVRLAVRSTLGYSLTIHHPPSQTTIVLHAVDQKLIPAEVPASLRVALVRSGSSPGVTIDFYAGQSGAFAQLAFEFNSVLPNASDVVSLEPPLSTKLIEPGVIGLSDFIEIHRAVGALMGTGMSLDGAYRQLHARAARTGQSVLQVACAVVAQADEHR